MGMLSIQFCTCSLKQTHLPSVLLQGKALAKQSRIEDFRVSGLPSRSQMAALGHPSNHPFREATRGNCTTHSTAGWSGIPSLLI